MPLANNHPMKNLITVVARYQLPAGLTADQIHAEFDQVAPGFRNVPGLVRKQFLRSKDCRTAGGVYLWNDEGVARAFMSERNSTNDSREVSGRANHRILRFACDRRELNAKARSSQQPDRSGESTARLPEPVGEKKSPGRAPAPPRSPERPAHEASSTLP